MERRGLQPMDPPSVFLLDEGAHSGNGNIAANFPSDTTPAVIQQRNPTLLGLVVIHMFDHTVAGSRL